MELLARIMLIIHITGGTTALLSGAVAMYTLKGGKSHRLAGKVYFGGMTAVFSGAVALSIAHHNHFLLMVGFFSYYMTVRGYRILYLKKLHLNQKPVRLDKLILLISGSFILALIVFGVWWIMAGQSMGIVAIVFGSIGTTFLISDVRNFLVPPQDKMHWWYGHINGMGGSYISAVTAFVVVNIQLPSFQWVLWIIPSVVGGIIIGRTIRKYRLKFPGQAITTP